MVRILNRRNALLATEILFEGTLTQAVIFPREIVKYALLKNAAAIICGHNHPSGEVKPSGDDQAITLDRRRIRRVIENLIGNARNALTGRGRITVETGAYNGGITLTVADDGPGIPPEIRQTLFDPFVSGGKSKGTGLGLAITKSIIEELGGRIDFTTKTDAGTTFRIWLPLK